MGSTPRDLENALILATYEAQKAWKALSASRKALHAARVDEVRSKSARAKRIREVLAALDPKESVQLPSGARAAGVIAADFQARLDNSATAREEFARLSKKDQEARLAWVDEAKSDAGRASRLSKTMQGLIKASDARRKQSLGRPTKGPAPGW